MLQVIHQGATRRPNASSIIYVRYKGELITGKVFDETDETERFQLSNLVPGWIEGVTKMNVGGRYIFYIPYELAYGKDGSGSVPPYSTLKFDITLDGSDDQLPMIKSYEHIQANIFSEFFYKFCNGFGCGIIRFKTVPNRKQSIIRM